MKRIGIAVAKTPLLGRSLLVVFRAWAAAGYVGASVSHFLKWLYTSRETTNFTYDLEEINKRYLASVIADVTNRELSVVTAYIKEIEHDATLRRHITEATAASGLAFVADTEVRFGRRLGWYAFARALKPKIVVETGVDKGLGSCVLTAALKKNAEEGYPGHYFGTDINPLAGYLLSGAYATYGRILYGDSIASLQRLDAVIDLFINDSDHSADYEGAEYETVAGKLSEKAIILGDNSHCSTKLLEFSVQQGRRFVFFQEKPFRHWYPGAGIGISFKR